MADLLQIISLMPESLNDYIHNSAKAGDILTTYDNERGERYWYFCTKDNIGENISPSWIANRIINKQLLEHQFKGMTLEEKVDFLINKHIENELYGLKNI